MRNFFVFVIILILGLSLNSTVFHYTNPSFIAPDIIVILSVIIAFYYPNVVGLFFAFILGLLADFASAKYLGPNAGGSVLAFALVGIIANRIYAEKMIAVGIIVFICCLAKSSFQYLMFYSYVKSEYIDYLYIFKIIFFESIVTGIFAPIIMKLLKVTGVTHSLVMNKSGTTASYKYSI